MQVDLEQLKWVFFKSLPKCPRIANNMIRLFDNIDEPFCLKFIIAFFIHEFAEVFVSSQKARVIENYWRKIMRMPLRTIGKLDM